MKALAQGEWFQVILARNSRLYVVIATMITYNPIFQDPDVAILDIKHLCYGCSRMDTCRTNREV